MRDLFFTILAIWIIWRIFESIKASKNFYSSEKKEGEVIIDHDSPKKNNNDNNEGEYIDYEEIK